MINLISDTVTQPTPAMLDYMLSAHVGDDVFGQDPTINALQDRMAAMFGMEAALFCPSGTMTNQIAIKCHTQPLDEMICDHYSHVYQYETGGYAFNSGVAVNLITGSHGKITVDQVAAHIRPDYDWLPASRLVVLENSCNKGGGSYYTLDEIAPITALCKSRGLTLHLDGARLFNVLVETGETTQAVGAHFDSVSICLSKGLGAPVGSVLIGSAAMIKQARRYRKVMGGGMRQAGYLAAACLYALDHHIEDLSEDNRRAASLGNAIADLSYVEAVDPVATNICIFHLKGDGQASDLVAYLSSHGVGASAFGPQTVRFVTHRHITDANIESVMGVLTTYMGALD
jgi:threonine aldolase